MFKTKFTLLDKNWKELYSYKSRLKPNEGEYLFVGEHNSYYKVIRVVHSIATPKQIILVVELVKHFSK